MRKIYFLFAIVAICLIRVHENVAEEFDLDKYDSGDTKLVEYEDNDDYVPEKPRKRDRIRSIKNFVGTNLFGDTGCRKKCFSVEDIALLAARRDFESLIPKDLPDCLLDDDIIKILMQYFYGANQVIEKMAGGESKIFAQKAFYDTLGGYLKYYMIPVSRYSYYAGLVKLRTVENVLDIYSQCKDALNTNGNDWRRGISDFTDMAAQIEPLRIIVHNEEEDTACMQLDLGDEHSGEEEDMIVALPRLDPEEKGMVGNVWLPFKRRHTFNLRSCTSAFVLLRYFELTTRCYHYEGVNQDSFNKKFKEWILENLEVHFSDNVLYPGFGAILRIVETLRRKNKGTIIVLPKTNAKRQKIQQNNKALERQMKLMKDNSQNWLQEVFGAKDTQFLDTQACDTVDYSTDTELCQQRQITKIIIIVAAVLAFLLLLTTTFLIAKHCSKKRDDEGKEGKGAKEEAPKKSKFSWLLCGSGKDDEEKSLKTKEPHKDKDKDSKSPSKEKKEKEKDKSKDKDKDKGKDKKKDSKKDSKKADKDQPPSTTKCFGLCSKKEKPDHEADKEGRKKKKGHEASPKPTSPSKKSQKPTEKKETPAKSKPEKPRSSKTVTVNEKKRFSISKKHKDDAGKSPERRLGLLKKKES